jgi:hypothetical protein
MDLVCGRVYDLIRVRAAQRRDGRADLTHEDIVTTLRDRFPSDPRPTFGEVDAALKILRLRRLIVGCHGRWTVVQQGQGQGDRSPAVPE